MRRILAVVVSCLALTVMAGAAEATVVFEDNFEDDTVGNDPDWEITESGGDVYVTNSLPRGGGTNSVYLHRTDDMVIMHHDFTGATQQFCIVDYYFRTENADKTILPGICYANKGDYIYRSSLEVSHFNFRRGSDWIDTGVTCTNDIWHHLKYVVDANQETWDWYINDMDTPVLTDEPWYSATASFPDRIKMVSYSNDSTFYIDDVTVTAIPEPGTGLLLLGGVTGLLFLRRRRS